MRILIADDSEMCRMITTAALTQKGHEVAEAVDGKQAWDIMKSPDAPKLAIFDWVMPKLDGLELVARIRNINTQHPPYIIMLTSRGETNDIVTALDAGANDYLVKPFKQAELQARVQVGCRMIDMQEALIKSREMLAHQAAYDSLTGIYNRSSILDILKREFVIANAQNSELSLGMCDIDNFKLINDTFGHQTGDEVLTGLAQILKEKLGESAHLGRIGGEEFLIITSAKYECAKPLFEMCRSQAAKAKIQTRSGALSVTLSIGVASCQGNATVDELLFAADSALYKAKKKGRNCVNFSNFHF